MELTAFCNVFLLFAKCENVIVESTDSLLFWWIVSKNYLKQSIQEWSKKTLWKTVFKKIVVIWFLKTDHTTSIFLRLVSHKLYLIRSLILLTLIE